jgi:hypothetical protein
MRAPRVASPSPLSSPGGGEGGVEGLRSHQFFQAISCLCLVPLILPVVSSIAGQVNASFNPKTDQDAQYYSHHPADFSTV